MEKFVISLVWIKEDVDDLDHVPVCNTLVVMSAENDVEAFCNLYEAKAPQFVGFQLTNSTVHKLGSNDNDDFEY